MVAREVPKRHETNGYHSAKPDADHLPPHDRHAEVAVIGSMVRDNRVTDEVMQVLATEDFYFDAHQKICRAVFDTWNKGRPVDLVTLADVLAKRKQVEDVGGYSYLASLLDAAPTSANCMHYCGIVRDKSLARQLVEAGKVILRDAHEQRQSGDELVSEAEQAIFAIAEKRLAFTEVESLSETIPAALSRLDDRHKSGGQITGLPTGIGELDDITSGLQPSELAILAARTSVGKTALAIAIARHVAVQLDTPVFFVSLEQSSEQLSERLLAVQSGVDSHKLRTGRFGVEDYDPLTEAGAVLRNAPLYIDSCRGQTVSRIAANARRMKRKRGIGLCIVDYVQIVDADNRRANRYEQVGEVTHRLHHLAGELRIPMLVLAQLSRASDDGQKPKLSSLRESGNLEQDADMVFLMHRPEVAVEKASRSNRNKIEIDVAKNRNGRTGDCTVTYLRSCMRFESAASDIPLETPFAP